MSKGKKSGAVIFLAILSIAGLGLSGYMFVSDLLSEENFKLVALWDNVDKNTDTAPYDQDNYFLIENSDQMVLNTKYVTAHNTTSISFATMGLYKINLKVIFTNIDASFAYWIILAQDSADYRHFDRWDEIFDSYYFVDSSLYINVNNSEAVFEIVCFSTDDFDISTSGAVTNQLSIEYIVP